MKEICIRKTLSVFKYVLLVVGGASFTVAHSNELDNGILVVQDTSLLASVPIQSIWQYTPPAPYNNATFTITAPVKVCVGQIFTIDYAIQVSQFTFISYWSDLVPDLSQNTNAKLIDVSNPTIGTFNAGNSSLAKKGGRGLWTFQKDYLHQVCNI